MENPTDHRDGHAVAERLITGSVRSGLTAVRDQRVIVGEALKALALARRQTTDGHGRGNPWRRVRIARPRWPFSREPPHIAAAALVAKLQPERHRHLRSDGLRVGQEWVRPLRNHV